MDKQNKFLNENRLTAYNVSTRTGENVIIILRNFQNLFDRAKRKLIQQINVLKVALSFQRMIAQLLGIKLSKLELEAHQKVVKAEVFVSQSQQLTTAYQSPSSICRVQ